MKKIALFFALVATCAVMTGCKTTELPTPEKVYSVSEGTGKATAVVVKLAKVDTNAVYTACAVMDKLVTIVPGSNETFVAVWIPKADELIGQLKIDETIKPVISLTVEYVCKGLDYEFALHSTWKQYENLVAAATSGFVTGFESSYGYTDMNLFASDNTSYDEKDVEAICKLCNVQYMTPKARAAICK